MLFHASIPADDPERVARVIAEIWRGESMAFPPVPGTFVAFAGDDRGSSVDVGPRGRVGVPAEGEIGFANQSPSPYSECHLALATPLTESEVLAIAEREGWTARVCNRGDSFKLVEFWVENKFLLEFLSPAQQKQYRANTDPKKIRAAFGQPA